MQQRQYDPPCRSSLAGFFLVSPRHPVRAGPAIRNEAYQDQNSAVLPPNRKLR